MVFVSLVQMFWLWG